MRVPGREGARGPRTGHSAISLGSGMYQAGAKAVGKPANPLASCRRPRLMRSVLRAHGWKEKARTPPDIDGRGVSAALPPGIARYSEVGQRTVGGIPPHGPRSVCGSLPVGFAASAPEPSAFRPSFGGSQGPTQGSWWGADCPSRPERTPPGTRGVASAPAKLPAPRTLYGP